ncbi:CRISPR-associated Csx4 family protein [Krasilnikovia cinnamomea]|uniref:CRISPR-associated Csx4 family protein n=1 Tax=Krasilnikovia cinnamomea TaxID=349313 RepID=A0A4Q7Z817_9ACTN|nr:type I-U CRISPR-associated RAMP protein Csb1/Cas7u [Krasilnikovia cinnamomea]RZU46647.1 CRISPR-associated Csx4 family protein [Krasilnikovia cinnamomea]
MASLADRLVSAVGDDRREAGFVMRASYQPVGGPGGRLMPPTFPPPTKGALPVYLMEPRRYQDAVRESVVLDQVPSQANRVEQALLTATRAGRVALPLLQLEAKVNGGLEVLTSLDFPHRYADAYLRDSQLDGVRFHDSELGRRLRAADIRDARALYRREPYSAVLGAWDSHRKGVQPRFARVYTSEMYGLDPVVGTRYGGRMDPFNLSGAAKGDKGDPDWQYVAGGEKVKGSKLSERGHGNIAPNPAIGGVTVSEVHRRGWVSFAGLERLGFGDASPQAAQLARATLAALAVAGDRLAFGRPSLMLRSGCDLTRVQETLGFELDGGELEPVQVSAAEALAAFVELRDRTADAGIVMDSDVVALEPAPQLAEAIRFSLTQAAPADTDTAA